MHSSLSVKMSYLKITNACKTAATNKTVEFGNVCTGNIAYLKLRDTSASSPLVGRCSWTWQCLIWFEDYHHFDTPIKTCITAMIILMSYMLHSYTGIWCTHAWSFPNKKVIFWYRSFKLCGRYAFRMRSIIWYNNIHTHHTYDRFNIISNNAIAE